MDEFSKLAYKMAEELGTLRGAISLLFAFGGQGYGPLDLSGEYVAVSSKALEYVRVYANPRIARCLSGW